MSRHSESRPLLVVLVMAASLLVHVPLLMILTGLFPQALDKLEETAYIEPIDFITEEEEKPEPKQIAMVSLDKPEVESEENKDAEFADRYNQKVEAEKQSQRKRNGRAAGNPNPVNKLQRPPKVPKQVSSPKKESEATPDEAPEDKGAPEEDKDAEKGAITKAVDDPSLKNDDVSPDNKAPSVDNEAKDLEAGEILPNINNAKGEGGDGAIKDYLDVPEGEKDLLNRKRVRYWAYFDRMKSAVRQHWSPNDVYRSNDPRRQVYGVEDRLTILKVTLNGDGSLRHLLVEKPSGVPFLDNEAVRAFRAASPFPNPPEAIKDENGLISLRFGFFLNIQTSGSRIIRFRR